ncbi:Protein-lysine N-methyltransferase rrg1 [Elasticomyces elasticus]|uniref:Protein-lysine N-methyltransferase rrg1 n=1 Tax=Exophiala sideris TaxID=1016849 RepID=A0ABR0IZC8_9EURO|nr:Protein-lysine N-methyltransferase rrg1 [Elasticomyces elasticus]KAK5022897.1 Protein-lysine N-methyltransferase rrg1 [Exophiala sideris]KAK5026425.1 Protein-lysine N-methyltransferase rrg1 [Exophiala sideris]KAK5052360.1 Protein-lysine N-methyltransferase rrg1 [Exophiala sideris]KAK5177387.1 Protein-lysine N-methyltransferase rrg1 [Eurotiomycetes sp. CCFEE 6388]
MRMSESPVTRNEPTALPQIEEDLGLLHVHDLPQLYQKPSASALLDTLKLLSFEPPSFSISSKTRPQKVDEQGVPRYLTTIVSSSLNWIKDDDAKESIWDAASARLSERSGRNAMPAMTRTFVVNEELSISLHEPSLTEDNLGLKTWTSSLLLAQRLAECRKQIPSDFSRVLELGAGTGLVGIAAACLWQAQVLLTDLPEIVPNLLQNLALNKAVIEKHHGQGSARTLDWADPTDVPRNAEEKYMVILAADPIYSSEHPKMLVSTVRRWICPDSNARFIVELPLRDRYEEEREDLRQTLRSFHFELVVEGTDTGHDDWHDRDGNQAVVKCWWSIWKPSDGV